MITCQASHDEVMVVFCIPPAAPHAQGIRELSQYLRLLRPREVPGSVEGLKVFDECVWGFILFPVWEDFTSAWRVFLMYFLNLMLDVIMPPANVSGECVCGFILRMWIECTFQFREADTYRLNKIFIYDL